MQKLAMTIFILVLLTGCDKTDNQPARAIAESDTPDIEQPAPAIAESDTPDIEQPAPAIAETEAADIEQVAAAYQNLTVMTPEPVRVDPQLARLCVPVTPSHVKEARKTSGPHANTSVMIYMNRLAANAFNYEQTPYPVGSIIIKEKTGLWYWTETTAQDGARTHDGVGGMIKRPAGYDPEHGDWEYFYFKDPTRVESGRMKSCVNCHQSAAPSDYVFGDWAPDN